jgi:hypothetical protein
VLVHAWLLELPTNWSACLLFMVNGLPFAGAFKTAWYDHANGAPIRTGKGTKALAELACEISVNKSLYTEVRVRVL